MFYLIYLHALVSSSEFVLKIFIIVKSRLRYIFSLFMHIVYLLAFNDIVLVQPVRLTISH